MLLPSSYILLALTNYSTGKKSKSPSFDIDTMEKEICQSWLSQAKAVFARALELTDWDHIQTKNVNYSPKMSIYSANNFGRHTFDLKNVCQKLWTENDKLLLKEKPVYSMKGSLIRVIDN